MELHSVMLWTEHVHGNRHRREPVCAVCSVVLRITAFGSASKFRTPSHFSRHFDRRRITLSRGPREDLHAEATLSLQASLRDLSSVRQTYAQLTFSRVQAPIPTNDSRTTMASTMSAFMAGSRLQLGASKATSSGNKVVIRLCTCICASLPDR